MEAAHIEAYRSTDEPSSKHRGSVGEGFAKRRRIGAADLCRLEARVVMKAKDLRRFLIAGVSIRNFKNLRSAGQYRRLVARKVPLCIDSSQPLAYHTSYYL